MHVFLIVLFVVYAYLLAVFYIGFLQVMPQIDQHKALTV